MPASNPTQPNVTITADDIANHRQALINWATANGIDPRDVHPGGLTIEQRDGHRIIRYRELQRDAEGRPVPDPERPNNVLCIERTQPLSVDLPEVLTR